MPYDLDMLDAVQRKLDELSACQCCDEGKGHTVNKPTRWEPWVELPVHGTQNPACKCCCRHEARILCRMHPDCKTLHAQEPAMQRKGEQLRENMGMKEAGQTEADEEAEAGQTEAFAAEAEAEATRAAWRRWCG